MYSSKNTNIFLEKRMQIMKKLISILLVVSMLMSFSIVAFAKNDTIKNGDVIQFGNYPQTLVTDNNLIKKLDKAPKKWVSYEHRYSNLTASETEGVLEVVTGVTTDNMQYADFSYDGVNYRGVNYINPSYIDSSMHWPSEKLSIDHDSFNTIFYFKYEPINWIVVDAENKIVMSKKVLDQKELLKDNYYNSATKKYYADANMSNYANDYSTSDLRKWLNNDFASTAFSASQIELISSSTYELDLYDLITDYHYTDGNTVTDKIIVPTSRDFEKYNISSVELSDYTAMQGHYDYISTRTAYDTIIDSGFHTQIVLANNTENDVMLNCNSVAGVVPMMKLSSLENNTDMALFENGSSCSCICHKTIHGNNFLLDLIHKIVMEIWSMFSIKRYCNCDLRHY